jgi:hypothetical protein
VSSLKEVLEDRIKLKGSYDAAFKTPEGQRVLRHLMKMAGLVPGRTVSIITDPNLLLVRQGQQHIVLSILRTLGLSATEITEQIQESIQNEE